MNPTIVLPAPGDHSKSNLNVGEGFDQTFQVNQPGWIQAIVVEAAGEVGDGEIEIKGGGYVVDATAQNLSLYMESPGTLTFTVKHVPGSGKVGNVQVMYKVPNQKNFPKLARNQRKAEPE